MARPPERHHRWKRRARFFGICLVVYLAIAYLLVPLAWEMYATDYPSFDDSPRITQTSDGHPGDPLNVGLIGTEAQVRQIMQVANWHAADRLGLKSDFKIGADTLLGRSYDTAPVSNLFLFKRKEDLAFEQPVGGSPGHRHHVRFWKTDQVHDDGRPVWVGSASYDRSVGLSPTTGQVTHHIAADVDTERDHVLSTLDQTHQLSDTYELPGFHRNPSGKNGGGDPWHTDGVLRVGIIAAEQ